jgi:Uma2 family endonuclease
MPEPDLLVLALRADFYREGDLRPEHVLLLVEVADTSLRHDREVKGPLYAAAGVAEYWIVDVEGRAIETYSDPTPGGYQRAQGMTRGMTFSARAFPGLMLSVSDILG